MNMNNMNMNNVNRASSPSSNFINSMPSRRSSAPGAMMDIEANNRRYQGNLNDWANEVNRNANDWSSSMDMDMNMNMNMNMNTNGHINQRRLFAADIVGSSNGNSNVNGNVGNGPSANGPSANGSQDVSISFLPPAFVNLNALSGDFNVNEGAGHPHQHQLQHGHGHGHGHHHQHMQFHSHHAAAAHAAAVRLSLPVPISLPISMTLPVPLGFGLSLPAEHTLHAHSHMHAHAHAHSHSHSHSPNTPNASYPQSAFESIASTMENMNSDPAVAFEQMRAAAAAAQFIGATNEGRRLSQINSTALTSPMGSPANGNLNVNANANVNDAEQQLRNSLDHHVNDVLERIHASIDGLERMHSSVVGQGQGQGQGTGGANNNHRSPTAHSDILDEIAERFAGNLNRQNANQNGNTARTAAFGSPNRMVNVNVNASSPSSNIPNIMDNTMVSFQALQAAQLQAAQQQAFANSLWDDLEGRQPLRNNDNDSDVDDDDSVDIIEGIRNSGIDSLLELEPEIERTSTSTLARSRSTDENINVSGDDINNGSTPPSDTCHPELKKPDASGNSTGDNGSGSGSGGRTRTPGKRRSARVANNVSTSTSNDANGSNIIEESSDSKPSATVHRIGSISSVATDAAVAPRRLPRLDLSETDAAVATSSPESTVKVEKRRMTRSMVRAKKNTINKDTFTDMDVLSSPKAQTRSRKRCRSSSPDRKKAAEESPTEKKGDGDHNSADDNCCICLDKPSDHELSQIDGCIHPYCFSCIEKWSERENSCPQCKSRFSKIERVHKLKKRRANGNTPIKENVKKVKTRDQRADYRPNNSLHGFFAHMEAHGLHGLNILFSAGGPGELFGAPPEPMLFSNIERRMDRPPGAQPMGEGGGPSAASGIRSAGYNERIAARNAFLAQSLFSPNITRHFGGGVPMPHPWTARAEPAPAHSPPASGSPSGALFREPREARRSSIGNTHLSSARSSQESLTRGQASATDVQRRFIRRVANLNGGQNLFFDVHDSRLGQRSRRSRAGGAIREGSPHPDFMGGAMDFFEEASNLGPNRGSQSQGDAFFMRMSSGNAMHPMHPFGNQNNSGNNAANALEIIDSDDE